MTTLVAVENTHRTEIASDSQLTFGMTKSAGFIKVIKNGEYMIAGAGAARSIQVLQFANLPPVPEIQSGRYSDLVHPQLDRFFTVEMVPAIRDAFDMGDKEALSESRLLVAVRNRIYDVNGPCGTWIRYPHGMYALGSGGEFALGALSAGATPEQAVEIAGNFDIGSNGDVTCFEILA